MRIFLDPGHGGRDPGANVKIKESQYTLIYALELGRALKELGFDIAYSRTTDSDVSLSERCAMANRWRADYFISIHFNSGGGVGIETYAFSTGGQGEKLANAVQIALITATDSRDRGRKFSNFQVLRDTSMPAILIEGGFVDSDIDSQKIPTEDYKRKYIQGATKGICKATGVAWKDPYAVAPVVADNATGQLDKDIYLSVRVLRSKSDAVMKQIIAMGYACKVLPLA